MTKRTCSIDGCDNPHSARGWCGTHYMNWRRNGDPEAPAKTARNGENLRWLRDRFDADDTDGCFSLRERVGRAVVGVNGEVVYAYVIVCEWQNGPRPDGMVASHTCGNGHLGCVNRRHLIWETQEDNMRRTREHGTDNSGARNGHAKLTEAQARAILVDRRPDSAIAAEYGVSTWTVKDIRQRRAWKHL